jgi:hypothetical protein
MLISLLAFSRGCGRPDVRFSILASTNDMPIAISKAGSNLTAVVFMATELHLQSFVFHVVNTQPRIVARHQ